MQNEHGHPVLEKIDTLLAKFSDPAFQDDVEKIKSWQKDAEDLVLRETLCENATLQELIKKYQTDVDDMNESLANKDSVELPDSQRDRLIDKKKLYVEFISTFDLTIIRKSLESVDKEVDEQLASLNS